MDASQLRTFIKQLSQKIGFADCEIVNIKKLDFYKKILKKNFEKKFHAEMHFLETNLDKRIDPSLLLPNAKSIICFITPYLISKTQHERSFYKIARYAHIKDYHVSITEKLNYICQELEKKIPNLKSKCCVDSAPILEKIWAYKSGLGFIGKNSLLISPKFGSFVFLSEIILDIEIGDNNIQPLQDLCGNCRKCIDACPTNAIVKDRIINSNLCIAYNTIEDKSKTISGFINKDYIHYIFGCDICQEVCPWNNTTNLPTKTFLEQDEQILNLSKEDWENINEINFNEVFKNSAIKRRKIFFLKRNIDFVKSQNKE